VGLGQWGCLKRGSKGGRRLGEGGRSHDTSGGQPSTRRGVVAGRHHAVKGASRHRENTAGGGPAQGLHTARVLLARSQDKEFKD
jgi:hypothetical protein